MQKILITGGAGFVGSSLADGLLQHGYHVTIVDNLLTGDIKNIPEHKNCRFIRADANNALSMTAIMTAHLFDYVFHYAAVVGVQRTLENPVWVLNDIQGIKTILELSKNTGVKRVFFSSSSEVYGEPVEIPQHEHRTPLNARLPYAVVKSVGESYLRSFQQAYNLDFTIFRFFNTYGPKQSTDFVISKFLTAALSNEPITIYGNGQQTRTFCYIKDNVDVTLKCLKENLVVNDVLNIGHDKIYTILELAETIIKITNSKSPIVFLPALKEGDMTRRQPDVGKMRQLLGRELTGLKEGLEC